MTDQHHQPSLTLTAALDLIIARKRTGVRAVRFARIDQEDGKALSYRRIRRIFTAHAEVFSPAEQTALDALLAQCRADRTDRGREVRVRVYAHEHTAIKHQADAAGMTVSDYVRLKLGLPVLDAE